MGGLIKNISPTLRMLILFCLPLADISEGFAEENETLQFLKEEAKVLIATRKEQTPEQAPAIVSIITRHEIEAYGARDLADILHLVPGFQFSMDVYSQAGANFRGIWVEEGKMLLMIDGIMQNELGYGNYTFFGTIPASIIEKVEIIRGPGSAIYGGFAEAAVINVITHRPENLNGARVLGDMGTVGHGGTSRYGNVSYGTRTDNLRIAAHAGYGSTLLSTRDYTDFFGNKLRLRQDNSYRQWQHLITEAEVGNLTVRYQRTSVTYGGQDAFTAIQPPVNGTNAEYINNYNDVTHLDYKAKVSGNLTVQPILEYTRNNTWAFPNPASIDANFEGSANSLWRYRGEMSAIYDSPWSAQMRFGGGYIEDGVNSSAANGAPGLQLSAKSSDLANTVRTRSIFGLFQYLEQFGPVGMTLGGRYEDTSFGNALAPRAGLTYVRGDFNAKLLYGRAFRIPMPWQAYSRNFAINGGLKPEVADTSEIEFGYKFSQHISGKINGFLIDIHQPIVYQGNTNTYVNFGKNESEGGEAELKADYLHFGGLANISFAMPGPGTSPGFVTRSGRQYIGSAPIKADLGAYYRSGHFEFSPSGTYLASRAGQSGESANDPNGMLSTRGYPALFLANLNIVAHDLLRNLDIHLSVHNVFDAHYILIQPYYGAHAPMPAQDREIRLGADWRF